MPRAGRLHLHIVEDALSQTLSELFKGLLGERLILPLLEIPMAMDGGLMSVGAYSIAIEIASCRVLLGADHFEFARVVAKGIGSLGE